MNIRPVFFCLIQICVSLVFISSYLFGVHEKRLLLEVKPLWVKIEQPREHDTQNSLVAASITLVKHYPKSLRLNGRHTIKIGCKNGTFKKLQGTLYQANSKNKLTLAQEYVVGDGVWDEVEQQLNITFEKSISLKVRTTFYLVLNIAYDDQQQLDSEILCISAHNFPFINSRQICSCAMKSHVNYDAALIA